MNEYTIEFLDGKQEKVICDYIEVLSGGAVCFWNKPESYKREFPVGCYPNVELPTLLKVLNMAVIKLIEPQEVPK